MQTDDERQAEQREPTLQIRAPRWLQEELRRMAAEQLTSVSALVRRAVLEHYGLQAIHLRRQAAEHYTEGTSGGAD
jgi:hypothetical protein